MLLLFIGPPCSGKTTTALRLAADLKDTGYPAEFLPEQARLHIARLRAEAQGGEVSVSLAEQRRIMRDQFTWEHALSLDPRTLVVADSSVLNGLLYLQENQVTADARDDLWWEVKNATLIFRCPPVPPSVVQDPNRIHSLEASRALDKVLDTIVAKYGVNAIPLHGNTRQRTQQAMDCVLERLIG